METQKAPGASTTAPAKENVVTAEDQKLVVGPGIRVQGDVTNCDALIIEGYFEGSAKSRIIQIARGGTVSGDVEVDTAEISGDFDGTLTVSNRLTVRSTGRVTGTVRYFAVEIDSGGQISGDIQVTDEGMTGSAETEDQTNSGTSGKLEAAS